MFANLVERSLHLLRAAQSSGGSRRSNTVVVQTTKPGANDVMVLPTQTSTITTLGELLPGSVVKQ